MNDQGFWKNALSDRFGPSSIRLCLLITVLTASYTVIFEVSAKHVITPAAAGILLALISLFSGGYYLSKKNEKDIILAQPQKPTVESTDDQCN